MVIVFLCTPSRVCATFQKGKKTCPSFATWNTVNGNSILSIRYTRAYTPNTHTDTGAPLCTPAWKYELGGAWPITFEPIKGEVLEQTRIKGGVAIVWSSYRFHWIRWHGLWGCGIFSFKRTRLEPNYIKKKIIILCVFSCLYHACDQRGTKIMIYAFGVTLGLS